MKNYLDRPYPLMTDPKEKWALSLRIGLFIFFFLYVFQPFKLSSYSNTFSIALGYGLIAFISTALFLFIAPKLFTNYFQEDNWTVGREIIFKVSPVFLIGLANTFYSMKIHLLDSFWKSFFYFEVCTLAVGIFPLMYIVYLIEKRSSRKYQKLSKEYVLSPEVNNEFYDNLELVSLRASNNTLALEIKQEQLLYLKSSANYVEVFTNDNNRLKKYLIRNTITSMENQLDGYKSFYRCHHSYLVNLDHIKAVTGNARGLKIHLGLHDLSLPVSRKNNEVFKQKLANRL